MYILFFLNLILYAVLIGMFYFQISDKSGIIFRDIKNPKYKKRVYISLTDMKTELANPLNNTGLKDELKKAIVHRKKFWIIFFIGVSLVLLKVFLNLEIVKSLLM